MFRTTLIGALLLSLAAVAHAGDNGNARTDSERAGLPGHALYMEKCAVCHGTTGEGDGPGALTMLPRPRIFTKASYKFRSTANAELPTDADMARVIREGVYGTAMPGFSATLSAQDVDMLVQYLKSFSEDFAEATEPPKVLPMGPKPNITDELLAHGKEIYVKNGCLECHGAEGRGDGKTWAEKKDEDDNAIVPANLTRWHQLRCGDSYECLFRATQGGLNGTPMPNYELSEEDRWALTAWLKSIHQPKKAQQDQVVVAKRLEQLPGAADDEVWQTLPESMFFLLGQIVQKPRLFWPSVTEIFVRAAYNDAEVVFLVEWDDRDVSRGRNLKEFKPEDDPVYDIFVATAFPDQMGLQFPAGAPRTDVKPYFLLGDEARPVNLWWWGSHLSGLDIGGIEDRNASGTTESIQTQDDKSQDLKASITYKDGRYSLVVRRALKTADPNDVQFEVGQFTPIGFNVMQGSRGEIGQRRAVSSWYLLVLEPPVPQTLYAWPVVGGSLVFGLMMLLVVRTRKAAIAESQEHLGTLGEAGESADDEVDPLAGAGDLPEIPANQRVGLISVATTIVVMALLIYAVVVGLSAVFTSMAESERDKAARGREAEIEKLRKAQKGALEKYEWKDEDKGVVTIPIDRAMDLVVDDAKKGKPLVPAAETPKPDGAAAPAPAPTPPPAATGADAPDTEPQSP